MSEPQKLRVQTWWDRNGAAAIFYGFITFVAMVLIVAAVIAVKYEEPRIGKMTYPQLRAVIQEEIQKSCPRQNTASP